MLYFIIEVFRTDETFGDELSESKIQVVMMAA